MLDSVVFDVDFPVLPKNQDVTLSAHQAVTVDGNRLRGYQRQRRRGRK
jgi:hypothetical protein